MDPTLSHVHVALNRQMNVQCAGQKRERAKHKSHDETDQIEEFPIHKISSAFTPPFALLPVSGLNTCKSRSANPGVSRIAPSNTRHLRESACFANSSRACFTCGSRRKRSAPAISPRSRSYSKV